MATIPSYDHLATDSVMAEYSLNDTVSTLMVPTGFPSTLEGAPNTTPTVTYFSDGENRLSFYGVRTSDVFIYCSYWYVVSLQSG